MNAAAYWKKLRAIGWLDYLPEEQHADVRETLERNLAAKVARCAHVALAQTACESDDSPEDMLRLLAKCSNGVFAPAKIAFDGTLLSFTHGGKNYAATVPESGEWAGTDVFDLANQALADSKIAQRFIELPDTPDFVGLVFVPPDIYAKAQQANLIPSKYRVDVCLVDSAAALKVASLKKIPAHVPKVFMWDMTKEQFAELLQMMGVNAKIKLRSIFNDPSTRRTVLELPSDASETLAKLPKATISEAAKKWMALSDADGSYFDGCMDLLWDRMYRVSELAQEADGEKIVLFFLKGV